MSLEFRPSEVTAIIGPSGCGKSTLVRCVNRMHEEIPGTRVEGAVKNFKVGDSAPAAGGSVRRVITIQSGIPIEAAKDIVKFLKERKLKKVQGTIQADQVRVSSPSKDDLQEAMKALRDHDFGVALQFGNYR